ncbi:TIGR03747 family integrating conjugative element membrane protein [Suttonella ornithocola]|uniref:Integrating conjugative element membrane protein, PFL_4697 family n=1 Tax=Suttonella ornithocola TaxID=279832 RepID=A0A380MVQ6_9GAMM|nr:TIGR03747 family integrating conjugative element membrane protein [Suttonella ornithocola]SUO96660.1 integrating conjugative element membrane protein, PFL_4697 family [Suttonella ornithocola]
MAEKKSSEKRGPGMLSPITFLLKLSFGIISFLIFTTIMSILLDWFGIFMGWWDTSHQLNVMKQEIAYLGKNFTTSIFGLPPADIAILIAAKIHDWLSLPNVIGNQQYGFMRHVSSVLKSIEPYWQNIVYSVMVTAIRCFIILLSTAFYVLVFFVAMIDGLVQRELRKVGGGLEHAQLFHHAKTWVGRVLVISPVLYLSWPNAVNPAWIVMPSAFLFGFTTYLTFSTYKKYL